MNTIFNGLDKSFVVNCHEVSPDQCESVITTDYKLKIMTFNIRSISLHFDEFLVLLNRIKLNIDIIILTECWLTDRSIVGQLDGYTSYRTFKFINKSGGVVAYVKTDLQVTVYEPSISETNCLIVEIANYARILGIYRSPSYKDPRVFMDSVRLFLQSHDHLPRLILVGDINIDILVNDITKTEDLKKKADYLCFTAELGLIPAITKQTRVDACLDHIFISPNMAAISAVGKSSITDHYFALIGINRAPQKNHNTNSTIPKIDYQGVLSEIKQIDWSIVTNQEDVNIATETFMSTVTRVVDSHTKIVKVKRSMHNLKPWITPGLIKCMKNRDALHSKSRMHPNNVIIKITYLRYRNYCINLLHSLKNRYERNELEINKSNPKQLWKTVKKICHYNSPKNQANELIKIKATTQESLDECNSYFSSVGKDLASNILTKLGETEDSLAAKSKFAYESVPSLFLSPTDEQEINSIIKQLQIDSAPGLDGIQNRLIKIIIDYISIPLTHICNVSMSSGKFPDCWKEAAVSPIHKAGPKSDPSNFRPISLLSAFSKILERIVSRRLVSFLESKNLLYCRQYGFRKGMNTEKAAGDLVQDIASLLDRGKACVGVFLDLAKAFDTVPVPILLRKLEAYFGIRGTVLCWFQSYLTNRRQRVKIGNQYSSPLLIDIGIPQGSILGPILFLLYINDISALVLRNAKIYCYADDTAIVFYSDSWDDVHKRVEQGMSMTADWLSNNLLTLNSDKTKYICFQKTKASAPLTSTIKLHTCGQSSPNKSQTDNPLIPNTSQTDNSTSPNTAQTDIQSTNTCNCKQLARTTTIKYLGIIIDESLSFKDHVISLSAKVRKIINIMKQLRNSANVELLKKIYVALCQSVLSYCLPVWGGTFKTTLIELERAQRSVLKVMLRKPHRYSTSLLFKETQFLSVRKLFVFRSLIEVHKNIPKLSNIDAIRSKRVFRLPIKSCKTEFAHKYRDYLHPYMYNKVNKICELQRCNLREMKIKLHKWLLDLSYDDVEKLLEVIK